MFEKVRNALAEMLEIDPGTITENTLIFDDLGADSLDFVELLSQFEDEYGVVIADDQVHELKTVGEVAEFLEEKLK